MKTSSRIIVGALLLSGLTLTSPAFARKGADDNGGTSPSPSPSGSPNPSASPSASPNPSASPSASPDPSSSPHPSPSPHGKPDHGGIVPCGKGGKNRLTMKLVKDASADLSAVPVKGKLKYISKKNGEREELVVSVKIGIKDGSPIPDADYADDDSIVHAAFLDSSGGIIAECDMDFDEVDSGKSEYQLKLKRRGSAIDVRKGSCDSTVDSLGAIADLLPTCGPVAISVDDPTDTTVNTGSFGRP